MRRVLFKSVLLSLLTLTACSHSYAKDSTAKVEDNIYANLDLFGEVFERIRSNYVEEVNSKDLIEAAINGMLSSLDPHSSYLNAKHFEEMQIQTRGEFGGLGIEVTMEAGFVKVVSPIDGTPASKAGIQAGDFITQLDDEAVLGLTLQEAVGKMRGKVGEDITVTVLREGEKEPLTITITRDKIEIRPVRPREYDNVGYLRITTFNENTSKAIEEAVVKIKKDLGDDLKGYVLDLRNNPGGLLDQAISVSDAFLDRGEIVSTRSRDDKDIQRYFAEVGDISEGKPLVVLINNGSASASEIVSGALKEHKRAILVGSKTFGKGSVQTIKQLGTADGALRLTTARYYTPSGESIQAKGIEPNILIARGDVKIVNKEKRFSEENLPKHLKNEKEKQAEKKKKEAKKQKSASGIKLFTQDDLQKDAQLKYAFDLMKAMPVIAENYKISHDDEAASKMETAQKAITEKTGDEKKSPKNDNKPASKNDSKDVSKDGKTNKVPAAKQLKN